MASLAEIDVNCQFSQIVAMDKYLALSARTRSSLLGYGTFEAISVVIIDDKWGLVRDVETFVWGN